MRLPDPLAEIVVSVFGKARSGPYMAYSFEIAAILCAAMYMLCFVWGTARNKRIANRWYEEVFDDLAKNFSHIGNGQGAILRDGPADYIAFGSGRARCVKFVARLMLRERQDLLSVVSDFFNSGHDRVRFDVVLDPAASENFILGILHTRHVRSTVSTYEELVRHHIFELKEYNYSKIWYRARSQNPCPRPTSLKTSSRCAPSTPTCCTASWSRIRACTGSCPTRR
ncbi:hypothetical protein BC828DRAFT_375713 [Blastocladiella britannica]|nr:hypothetical protein BC828DRAFT_375713 [Blastocladiella britannica]